ncbi:GNAT family N-acetyltransferase [Noviherbaspirillum saxi]|uniref:GNAT family N-acetyltransferase n=1 Tax=Noviherbaspirillum saxi TaxID=2320863 RepID=UPI001F3F6C32|nr:GNAT family N-acetyltransferase [Noviherbaspirillum saxi]
MLADLETIVPLFDGYRCFYGKTTDPAAARTFIAERLALNESVIFIAQDHEGKALGFTQLYPSFSSVSARRIWILNDLFVAATARGRGVGKMLLDAAREHAVRTGAKRLALSTAHDNPAQKLYESQGYVRDRKFFHYELELE